MANYYCEEGCGDSSLVECPIREAGECPSKPSAERVTAAKERVAYLKGWKDRGEVDKKNAAYKKKQQALRSRKRHGLDGSSHPYRKESRK